MSLRPLVPLSELLTPAAEPVRVEPEREYPNLGIYSFGRGVFKKPPISGAVTSASTLYRVSAGQLIYSRLFSFEGAYALVPEDFDGYYVSNEFPVFDIDASRVEPEYLRLYFLRPSSWAEIASMSEGMGDRRKRIHPDKLLSHRIQLPSMAEQKRWVSRVTGASKSLARRRVDILGISEDAESLLASVFEKLIANVPRLPMSEVAPLVRRWVEIDKEEWYTEIGVKSFFKGIFHRRTVSGSEYTWQDLYTIREGDIVFSNLMAWERAIAVAGPGDHGCVGNHRMLTCEPRQVMMLPGFLMFYFMTDEGFREVYAASPGTAARNRTLSPKLLEAIQVPVPPLDRQFWFTTLQAKVARIRSLQAEATADADRLISQMLDRAFRDVVAPPAMA